MAMASIQPDTGLAAAPPATDGNAQNACSVPRIILAGEPNSGKTTLVNVLLQTQLLVTDIVTSTPCPMLLRFGEHAHLRVLRKDGSAAIRPLGDLRELTRAQIRFVEVYLPSPALRNMEILDLPGFSSPAEAEAYSQWLGAAEILIWCTVATQAWKASEQAMWLSLARPKSGSFLVLTHRDLLSDVQLGDVTGRVSRETQRFFSQLATIAAPQAVAARSARGAGTGLTDFTQKLQDLLETAPSPPRQEPAPVPPARSLPAAEPAQPLPAFAEIRQRILAAAGNGKSPAPQAAAIMAREFEAFARQTLRPWLASHRHLPAARSIESLLPVTEADLVDYLSAPQPGDGAAAFTPAQILVQIEAELEEALHPQVTTASASVL